MGTMTRDESAERLAELKHMNVPRCSLDRLKGSYDADKWAALFEDEALAAAFNTYLRGFAWLEGTTPPYEPGTILCPGCATRGYFSWGITHGHGNCSCGWPGTLYHYVADPAPGAPCYYCEKTPGAHDGPDRLCHRDGDAFDRDRYKPRNALKFTQILWAHPYDVRLAGRGS